MDDGAIMAAVAMDEGGWIAILVLGVLAAFALVALLAAIVSISAKVNKLGSSIDG
jgi:hypothetical protein